MSPHIKKRLTRIAVLSLVALVIGAGVGWLQVQMRSAVVLKDGISMKTALPVAGLQVGGAFTLSDHNGEKFTQSDLEGRYSLIYFGFTYCPAVCPTELQKISRVMGGFDQEAPALAKQIQPLFVTIDPERDDVAVMKDYVSLFDKRLIGLTGTMPQMDHMKKIYRVFAKKAWEQGGEQDGEEDGSDYTMDHSSYIYFMGPDGALVSMYRAKDTADYIYNDIKKRLMASSLQE